MLSSVKTLALPYYQTEMTKIRAQVQSFLSIDTLSESCDSQFFCETMTSSLLSKIPPERVGLTGEYDHSGLAKRVLQAFQAEFSSEELDGVRVTQRGKIVVLLGSVADDHMLARLVWIALRAEGAIGVETTGIRLK